MTFAHFFSWSYTYIIHPAIIHIVSHDTEAILYYKLVTFIMHIFEYLYVLSMD